MKITDVEAIIVRQPEISLIGDGTQDSVIILVHTDEGITGIAEVDSAPFLVKAAIEMPDSHSACRGLKNILLGENPLDIERLWNKMYHYSYYQGRGGVVMHAISGIDMALWDIMGKALHRPVSQLIGGSCREKIPAYISILMPETEEEVKKLVDYHMVQGYSGIKFGWGSLGQDPKRDIALIRAAREALGSEKKLMIDIAMGWDDYKIALNTCHAFEEYDVFWVEEPFCVERKADFSKLRSETALNITAGEELCHVDEFDTYIREGCVDILQPDMSRCGGLTAARKIRDLACRSGIPIIPHNFKSGLLMSATLQFIAALPNALYLEYCGQETVLSRQLIAEPIQVKDGWVSIPDSPGFGVELNWETVEKYRVS